MKIDPTPTVPPFNSFSELEVKQQPQMLFEVQRHRVPAACFQVGLDSQADVPAAKPGNSSSFFLRLLIAFFFFGLQRTCSATVCEQSLGGFVINRVLTGNICITNDVSFSNVTVTPGTTLLLTTNASIHVLGPIHLIGSSNASIRVLPSPENTNGWQGFSFENTPSGSEFDFVTIEGAQNSALSLIRSQVVIRNSIFTNNYGSFGGALNITLTSGDIVLTNCIFANNFAVNDGGAVWANLGTGKVHFVQCTFTGNAANYQYQRRETHGGALCLQGDFELIRCDCTNNQAHGYTIYAASGIRTEGGALWASADSGILIACNFSGNACQMITDCCTPDTSWALGGAVFLSSGTLVATNSLFAENWLSAWRAHVYQGSAIYVAQGNFIAANSTIVNNSNAPAVHNAAGFVTVHNSILYFNFDHATQILGEAAVTYSDIQGGWPDVGNIDFNPVVDNSYRILPGSPCIDAADPASQFNDAGFPPALGSARGDMGICGGPLATAWLDVPYTGPQQLFKVATGTVVLWTDRPNTYLQHAADLSGPWYQYTGTVFTVGSQLMVLIEPTEPRKFFRLAQY